ncbi:MAG: CvpA family protein [Phycisphaerae bacterium]
MILDVLAVLLILSIAGYLGNQGTFSALIALIASAFASLFAAAMFEPLMGPIAGWRPDYARGVTFLVLFFLALSACRIAADMIVLKNIRMNKIVDRSIGAIFGFFAGMIVVGSTLVGIQMLPLGTTILGYDRYGTGTGMRVEGDPAAVASGSNIWLSPDNFTVGMWELALGKALGGSVGFENAHPNFLVECYGYRQTVEPGANTALPKELLNVPVAWQSADPAILKQLNIEDPDKAVVMVRAEVSQGGDPPKSSVNMGTTGDAAKAYFFITPTEIRLVTDKARQYYPIGYLERGTTLIPMPYDSGQIADDMPKDKTKVVEDWLFEINKDEKPKFVEMKQLARVQLADVLKNQPVRPEAATAYAPRTARAEQATVIVRVNAEGMKSEGVKVYITTLNTTYRDARSTIVEAYDANLSHLKEVENGTGGSTWVAAAGKPGVPNSGDMNTTWRMLQNMESKGAEDSITFQEFLQYLFPGAATPDGVRNLVVYPEYFNNKIVPLITPAIIAQGETDSSGKVELKDIPKGSYDVIAMGKGDKAFYFWIQNKQVQAKATQTLELSAKDAAFSAVLK